MDRELEKPEEISIAVSPRHFSVGSDGLITVSYTHLEPAEPEYEASESS